MDGPLMLIFISAIVLPLLLTFLYSRLLSPVRRGDSLSALPLAYKIWLVLCVAAPIVCALLPDYMEKTLDVDNTWPFAFSILIIMCIVVMDAVTLPARHNKWRILLALPHFVIAAIATAVLIFMTLYALDTHSKMF